MEVIIYYGGNKTRPVDCSASKESTGREQDATKSTFENTGYAHGSKSEDESALSVQTTDRAFRLK